MFKQNPQRTPVIRLHGVSAMPTSRNRKSREESLSMDLLGLPRSSVQTPPPGRRQSISSSRSTGRTKSALPPSKTNHAAIKSASRYFSQDEHNSQNQQSASRLRETPSPHPAGAYWRTDYPVTRRQILAQKDIKSLDRRDYIKSGERNSMQAEEKLRKEIPSSCEKLFYKNNHHQDITVCKNINSDERESNHQGVGKDGVTNQRSSNPITIGSALSELQLKSYFRSDDDSSSENSFEFHLDAEAPHLSTESVDTCPILSNQHL
ncbi:uncharacterized protein LOC143237809 [Tachypleus tridentatus]|uniref:uncharacterized protein LOC143237809 n=1 Tax=Tachypleus tridentatus TaxID=6853 RepID=UPI003FD12D56